MKANRIIAALALVTWSVGGWAAAVAGASAPSAESTRQVVSAQAAASHADDSSSMREGVITAVNEKRDQVEINGAWLRLVAGKSIVFRNGRSAQFNELGKGQKVKFTLAPGVADRATLGAIYVP